MCLQKIKEEVASPKTTKRARESSAQEPDEPEKVTPKRAKTQVRGDALRLMPFGLKRLQRWRSGPTRLLRTSTCAAEEA